MYFLFQAAKVRAEDRNQKLRRCFFALTRFNFSNQWQKNWQKTPGLGAFPLDFEEYRKIHDSSPWFKKQIEINSYSNKLLILYFF